MATIGGSNIATDGLVLALDAANPRSYVSGSTISNLIRYSQNSISNLDYGNLDNTNGILTATTGALAPDSTNTAVLMVENTALNQHRFYGGTSTTLSSNTLYTYSIYAKSAGRTKGLWYAEWTSGRIGVNYDLAAGTVSNYQTGTNTLYTSSITNSGNGWYRISFTSQDPASLSGALYVFRMADDTNAFTYTGNGVSGSYFWGVQIEQNSYMTPYLATSGSIGYRDTLFDLSGNNSNGVLINGPTYNTVNNGNIVFNGTSQYVLASGTSTFNLSTSSSLTYSVWIYPTSLPSYQGILTKNRSTSTQGGLWLFSSYPTFGAAGGNFSSPISITTNKWYHIVGTQDGNTGRYLYVNGTLVASGSSITQSGTENIWIGGASGVNEYFYGSISNAQIHNRALSSQEVLQNYNAQKSRYNL
jgi:hypothetical protein